MILKFWLIDDLYAAPYGRGVLNNLTGTPQYLSWLARILRPHVGDEVLEVGAGIGNLTGRLMSRRAALRRRREEIRCTCTPCAIASCARPTWWCSASIPEVPGDFAGLENCFDTVLCLNVLEHLDDPGAAAGFAFRSLRPGGAIMVLVPNVPGIYGSLDRSLGHKRRYSRESIRELLEAHGFDRGISGELQ